MSIQGWTLYWDQFIIVIQILHGDLQTFSFIFSCYLVIVLSTLWSFIRHWTVVWFSLKSISKKRFWEKTNDCFAVYKIIGIDNTITKWTGKVGCNWKTNQTSKSWGLFLCPIPRPWLTRSVRDNELSLIGRMSVKQGSTVLPWNDCR